MSITLPDTITSIGAYAFYNCKGLTELVLPDGVTSIGYSAFQGCDSLERINIPKGVTTLEVDTFSGCKSLKSIELPEGMTVLKRGVFNNCQSLASVVIPQTVEIIESRAFYGCRSLTEVVIPDSVTEISDFAFADCEGLQRLVIPKGIQSISGYAFDCTYHIQHAVMPTYAITYIPRSELKTVVFTAGDWIKEDALKDCSALEKIVFCGTETEWKTLQTKAAWKNGPAKLATYHDCTWTATESRHTGECAMCGAKIDAAHSWDAGTVIQAATHLETGKKKQTCDACKESREVVLEKLTAHTYGNETDLGESQHKQVCSCGEEKLSSHAYGSWKVVEKATEAAEGRYERSCACGRIETKAIPRLDHDYETHVITPTCTEPGYHEYVCKNCSESYCDSFVEALGHRHVSDADTVCAECGALREIVTDAPPAEEQSGCGAWVSGWGVMLLALAAGCGACLKRKGQPKKKTCNV